MDFEVIDEVYGDALEVGDILCISGEYHHLKRKDDDENDLIVFTTYNLSTGDEDSVLVEPSVQYEIHRSY